MNKAPRGTIDLYNSSYEQIKLYKNQLEELFKNSEGNKLIFPGENPQSVVPEENNGPIDNSKKIPSLHHSFVACLLLQYLTERVCFYYYYFLIIIVGFASINLLFSISVKSNVSYALSLL